VPWSEAVDDSISFDSQYYRNNARGHIQSHSDEDDPERLAFLIEKGEESRQWIANKYGLPIKKS
jgi:hypothetical protein